MSTTWINRGHFYVPHVTPVMVDCNFVVTPTNALGITALKGQGVANVFMHTSTTPGRGSNGYLNPNPAAGIIMVQLTDNFYKYYGGYSQVTAPNSTASTSTVANVVNVITVLGTATAAQWLTVGLPPGVTAAVGVAFVATTAAVIGGSAQTAIVAPAGSAIQSIEISGGNANLSLSAIPVGGSPNVGGFLYFSCYASSFTGESYTPVGTNSAPALTMNSYTPAGTNDGASPPLFTGTPATLTGTVAAPTFTGTAHTLAGTLAKALTAPATGSLIRMSFYMSQSSVVVAGE